MGDLSPLETLTVSNSCP